jgi:hypothetical protein
VLVTDPLISFLKLGDVPMGFLSQRYDGSRFVPYQVEIDLATGARMVDDQKKLRRWLEQPGRTWILADFRLDLHLDPAMRKLVLERPLVYRSDPALLEGCSPHPDWAGNTYELRLFLTGADAEAEQGVALHEAVR